MAKRIIGIMLVILVSFLFVSCNQDKSNVSYPDYLTGEYVQEHYELVDMNLVYLKSYHKRTSSVLSAGVRCRFMQIKDVPLKQFLGVTSSLFMSSGYRTYVLFNSTSSVNPIYDFEVDKMELYVKDGILTISSSNFDKYGEILYDEPICEIDSLEVKQEILASIRYAEREDLYAPIIGKGSAWISPIAVRIHFKEYENIVWDAEIGRKEGKYYLSIILVDEEQKMFSLGGNHDYIYVGQQFDALMESIIADL